MLTPEMFVAKARKVYPELCEYLRGEAGLLTAMADRLWASGDSDLQFYAKHLEDIANRLTMVAGYGKEGGGSR